MKLSCDFVGHDDLCVSISGERERNGYVLSTGANDRGGFAVFAGVLKSDCSDFVHSWRVASPNDLKLSDSEGLAGRVPPGETQEKQTNITNAPDEEARGMTARSCSLQRMVRPLRTDSGQSYKRISLQPSLLQCLCIFLCMLRYKCRAMIERCFWETQSTIVEATALEVYASNNNVNVSQLRDILGYGILRGWLSRELARRRNETL